MIKIIRGREGREKGGQKRGIRGVVLNSSMAQWKDL